MNVAAYCRVSTDMKDQLNSLETQRDFFHEYALKMGHHLVHIYADQGISGTKTKNRADFNRMMNDAKAGFFSIILVKDISRFARNTVDLLEACRMLREYGVEVQFINYKMSNMGGGELLLTMFAAVAQEESYNISKRIKFSKQFNAQKGKVPNFVYGYEKTKGDYFHLDIHEKEAKTVQDIFRWYTQDGEGTLKIANRLNGMGLLTKRAGKWTSTAVARILTNEIYIGNIINGKEEIVNFPESKRIKKEKSEQITVKNEALRIISDEIFQAAQSILQKRTDAFHLKKQRHSNQHLFSTLIKCSECGASFRRVVKTYKNTYIRWVCGRRNGHGADTCANSVSVDENELIAAIETYFAKLLENKDSDIKNAILALKDSYIEQKQTDKKAEIQEKIHTMKTLRERTLALFTDGYLTMEEVNSRIGHIKIELPRLEAQLQRCKSPLSDDERNPLLQDTKELADIRQMSNAELKKIIKEIVVHKNGQIDIYFNEFDNINK